MHEHKTRKRWRRKRLAEHFDVNVRTIDAWSKPERGTLPPPHYLPGSKIPFWYADEIENLKQQSA